MIWSTHLYILQIHLSGWHHEEVQHMLCWRVWGFTPAHCTQLQRLMCLYHDASSASVCSQSQGSKSIRGGCARNPHLSLVQLLFTTAAAAATSLSQSERSQLGLQGKAQNRQAHWDKGLSSKVGGDQGRCQEARDRKQRQSESYETTWTPLRTIRKICTRLYIYSHIE